MSPMGHRWSTVHVGTFFFSVMLLSFLVLEQETGICFTLFQNHCVRVQRDDARSTLKKSCTADTRKYQYLTRETVQNIFFKTYCERQQG